VPNEKPQTMPKNKNIEKLYELKDFFSVKKISCESIIKTLKQFFSKKIENQVSSF
jgi:hypothetical protein